ncbi:hypothetical protein [Streptomyces sp. NPDC001876]|uniref:hypothetical protein n=1 Tax=Streptomyces sp. NPDC001876 TaxID=3154402 RepID=UPI003317ED84
MFNHSRTLGVLAAVALTAGGLTAATTATAAAAPTAVQSCLGGAKSFSSTYTAPYRWPGSGSVTTTSTCNDINVKPYYGDNVRTCFLPSSGGTSCNAWRWISGGVWGLAATDVKDGTKFYVEFQLGYEYGSVAY